MLRALISSGMARSPVTSFSHSLPDFFLPCLACSAPAPRFLCFLMRGKHCFWRQRGYRLGKEMDISQSWPQLHHSTAPGLAVSGESSHVQCGVQEAGTREVGRMQINQDLSNTPENSFLRDKCLQRKPSETPTTCSARSVAEQAAFITATCRGRVPAEHPPNFFFFLQLSSARSPRCPPRGRRVAFAAM